MRAVSYQVFARKYRPRIFDDVLGQDHVMRTLRNAITQQRLAHAYLFVGPRGTGKTSTARIFAKALNCPGGPSVDFDPDNELCVEIEKGICLDVREIDGASNNGVDQVRELREEVKFAPSRCRYKIYYIDEVHMLSTAAFNALLKTLEEPPEHVKFIFATTEAHKVLPTIISRCQRFDLRRIPSALIAKHLLHIATLEKVSLEEKAAYAIAKGADGGMRDAQSMLDQLVAFCGGQIVEQDVMDIFGFTRGETVANIAQRVLERDTVGALRELHAQADAGKDLARLLADVIQHFRTILVHQVDKEAALEDLAPEVAALMGTQSGMWPAESLLRVMDGLAEVDARMRWAGNKLLHFEIGLIQSVQALGEVTLSEVIEAIGKGDSGAAVAPREAAPVKRAAAPAPAPAVVARVEKPSEAPAPAPRVSPPKAQEVPPPPPPKPAAIVDSPESFWKALLQRVHDDRPLLLDWLTNGTLVSCEGSAVKVALPATEKGARDNLLRPATKKNIEDMCSELLGREVSFEVALDSNLKPPPATEQEFGFDSPPAAADKPAATEDFYNDPLINKAMEIFKATLVK
jgi:DNA polymerase-3 subunit gamma/tau